MRVAWGLVLISGCVAPMRTIEHFPAERMALSTMPVAPLAASGSPGVSLAGRLLTAEPLAQPHGGAVSFPSVQPELGLLVQLGDRTWVGGRFDFVTGGLGVKTRPGAVNVPQDAVAFDLGFGAGHDLRVQQDWGFTFSAEAGISGAAVTSTSGLGTFTLQLLQPAGRAAIGVYATPGPVRLFLVGSVTTGAWNTPTSVITRDCFTECTLTDTGVFAVAAVGMVGGGARWQVSPQFSLALELWVPLTAEATRVPPMISLTVRAGDLVFGSSRLTPPPPPPQVLPESVGESPQL